ncbi:Cyclin-Dependent Kinase [Seminavis robusta]|uniref:Cyclin-Dependent Kinase n=1 Tax=Seminavis robusta TaxID=568900 RepID=A0A9N8E554_9STRA|nr:Cyclin-Dependent Kinase [Seminavis robusta]|eukprot:Sro553_g165250.1 Cyclin-Dependent Kinase (456) ;mRNA; r:12641-14008
MTFSPGIERQEPQQRDQGRILRRHRWFTASAIGMAILYVVGNFEARRMRVLLDEAENPGIAAKTNQKSDRAIVNPETEMEQCQHLPWSTSAFVRAVHDDPENVSLKTWTGPNSSAIPRLDSTLLSQAFGGKRVALIGDSTLFQTLQRLHQIIMLTKPSTEGNNNTAANQAEDDFLAKLSNTKTLTKTVRALDAEAGRRSKGSTRLVGMDALVEDVWYDHIMNAHIFWTGFRGYNMKDNCHGWKTQVWPKLHVERPDVIVANWGLHMLHHGIAPKRPCNVHQFIHYEEDWLETVLQVAREVGTKLLLFKTTNYICEERYPKQLQHGLADLAENTSTVVAKCITKIQKSNRRDGEHYNLTDDDMHRYCIEGAGTDHNVQLLNDRLRKFVERAQTRVPPGLTIAVCNDHDMESCPYTRVDDGSHYPKLQLPRIRMLAHMVHCLWADKKDTVRANQRTN